MAALVVLREKVIRPLFAASQRPEPVSYTHLKHKNLVPLKPSLRTISLRLPVSMIEDLKVLANRRDVRYQSLFKVFLAAWVAAVCQSGHCRDRRRDSGLGSPG